MREIIEACCQFVSYTLDIEAVSCDELFVDCIDLLADTASSPLAFASLLRQEIQDKTGCMASVGIGSLFSCFSLQPQCVSMCCVCSYFALTVGMFVCPFTSLLSLLWHCWLVAVRAYGL